MTIARPCPTSQGMMRPAQMPSPMAMTRKALLLVAVATGLPAAGAGETPQAFGTPCRLVFVKLAAAVVALTVLGPSAALAAPPTDGSTTAPPSVIRAVTHVPRVTLDAIGAGDAYPQPLWHITHLRGRPATRGKVNVLTVNIAWCPHCAANSWALAIALSRFGALSG